MSEISHADVWDEEALRVKRPQKREFTQLLQRAPVLPQNPKEALLRSLTPQDTARLARIAQVMRSKDIVQYARNVHWNKPPERERDSKTAVDILMRIGSEPDRRLLERMTRGMPPPEIIEFLQRVNEGAGQPKEANAPA